MIKPCVIAAWTSLLLVAQAPVPPAQPVPADLQGHRTPAMTVTPVGPEVKVLEEKTLIASALLASVTINQLNADIIGDGKREYNDPATSFQASGNVNRHLNNSGDDMDMPNAMRLYGFTLEPGEKLHLKMKSEHAGKMWMKIAPPPQQDAMASEILSANRMPKPMRATRLSLRNVTKEPYKLILQVYGEAGNAYRIDIERKK